MEQQLNRIELRGNVGNIRISTVGENKVAKFSVATNYVYTNKEGEAVVETTWHNISAWESHGIADLERIEKGTRVYVVGRMRSSKYTGSDGMERQSYEVIASKVERC